MVRLTRRSLLYGTAGAALLPVIGGASRAASIETVVSIPEPDKVPENLAVDDEGALYFGIARDPGEVYAVAAEQTAGTDLRLDDLERVAELPAGRRVIGVEVVPDGTLYVAVASDGDDSGVWVIPPDGDDPSLYAAISGFANDVLYDGEHDRLLVSESFGGAVYAVPLDVDDPTSAAALWAGTAGDEPGDLLDTASFGANGLTVGGDGAIYVAVTRVHATEGDPQSEPVRGRIVRIPVDSRGDADEPELVHESEGLLGADGLTGRGRELYVAANALDRVVRVTPSKRVLTVASAADGLVFPSDVAFGTVPGQRDDLFVCNFANDSPEDGAILRIRR